MRRVGRINFESNRINTKFPVHQNCKHPKVALTSSGRGYRCLELFTCHVTSGPDLYSSNVYG